MTRSIPLVLVVLALAAPASGAAQAAPQQPPAPPQQPPAPPQQPPAPPQQSAGATQQPPTAPSQAGVEAEAGRPMATRVLTLDEAVRTARARAPQLRQAQSAAEAAQGRADQARAALLPQLQGTASYQRTTLNPAVGRGGTVVSGPLPSPSFTTRDAWAFSATATQLLFDFGQTTGRYAAARSTAEAQAATAAEGGVSTVLAVRTVFFQARAAKDLVGVAQATLQNQEAHLAQIRAFVDVGTRPPIDLAQARADRANAQVSLVTAENSYDTARARLRQAIGLEGAIDWDVADERFPPVDGEDAAPEALLAEATRRRPDLVSAERQVQAADESVSAARGGYGPALGLEAGATDQGGALDSLRWNVFAGATLSWNLFEGGRTRGLVREASANLDTANAARDQVRQQVVLDLDTARLAVRAAKATRVAADDAVVNTRERLRLAEGRYRTGAGSALELSDAQVAATNAEAQTVQAEYQLATARAQLLAALGRDGG